MKTANFGLSSTGNNKGAWPGLWVKSINSFFNLSESYLEYDIYEGYSSDSKGFHNSYHNWPALRLLPGRLQSHRYLSNYLGLTTANGGWHESVDLFDNQWHTYGVMVTPQWTINMFDGRETFRFPTTVEMKQPLWLLVDLALLPAEASQASGVYDLTIDYIRVYQNPVYTPFPIVEYTFNETGTTAASTGYDSTPMTLYSASDVAVDLHSAGGAGVSGRSGDRALDLTAASGMGLGYTGPYARQLQDNENLDGLKSFTVTGWFKTDAATPIGNFARLIANTDPANGSGYRIAGDNTFGYIRCAVDSSGVVDNSFGATQQWVFAAVSYDGTVATDNVKFYVGSTATAVSLLSTTTLNKGAAGGNTAPLYVGNDQSGDQCFDGYLDNVRIYGSKIDASGVLSLEQLKTIHAADVNG